MGRCATPAAAVAGGTGQPAAKRRCTGSRGSALSQLHEVKLERNNAQENVEDEQDKVQDMLLHSDLQQSAIGRLKALCAANGIDGAAVQSAAALRR